MPFIKIRFIGIHHGIQLPNLVVEITHDPKLDHKPSLLDRHVIERLPGNEGLPGN